jgi:hemin uptake protein HemP
MSSDELRRSPDEASKGGENRQPMHSGVDDGEGMRVLTSKLPKVVSFRELCRCGDEVWIENDGQLYRLRRTRQGKLILTK